MLSGSPLRMRLQNIPSWRSVEDSGLVHTALRQLETGVELTLDARKLDS